MAKRIIHGLIGASLLFPLWGCLGGGAHGTYNSGADGSNEASGSMNKIPGDFGIASSENYTAVMMTKVLTYHAGVADNSYEMSDPLVDAGIDIISEGLVKNNE